MKIYLDSDFHCHLTDDGTMKEADTDFFDGKCAAFTEGYRYVPDGEIWTRADGVQFRGLIITPAEDYAALEKAQVQYELDETAHLEELGALIEEIYNEDADMIDNM